MNIEKLSPFKSSFTGGIAELEAHLVEARPWFVRLENIENGRLSREIAATELLSMLDGSVSVGDFRGILGDLPTRGVMPEAFLQIAEQNGYNAKIVFGRGGLRRQL